MLSYQPDHHHCHHPHCHISVVMMMMMIIIVHDRHCENTMKSVALIIIFSVAVLSSSVILFNLIYQVYKSIITEDKSSSGVRSWNIYIRTAPTHILDGVIYLLYSHTHVLTLTFNPLYFSATETRNRLEDQTHPPTHTEKAAEGHLSPFFGSPEMKT